MASTWEIIFASLWDVDVSGCAIAGKVAYDYGAQVIQII